MLFYTTFTIDADILYIKSGNAATVLRYCTLSVFVLCKHCSGNSVLVRIFLASNSSYSSIGTVATVVTFFFLSVCIFFFPFIYIVLLHIIYKKRECRYSISVLCTQRIYTVQALYR